VYVSFSCVLSLFCWGGYNTLDMLVPLLFYDQDETKMKPRGIGRGAAEEGDTKLPRVDSSLQAHV